MQKRKPGQPHKGWKASARKRLASKQHELLPFLAIWAVQYQKDWKLDGLHPRHHALMKKYGAPMERFPIATNAEPRSSFTPAEGRSE